MNMIKNEDISQLKNLDYVKNEELIWINIQNPTREKMNMIGEKFSFHELNIDDCLSKFQLPKIDKYDDHVFVILHLPTGGKDMKVPKISQLSIFIGANYLVTAHQGDLKPLVEMFQLCHNVNNLEQRQLLMGKSSGYLLHTILDVLVDDLLHILMKLIGNLNDIEDAVFDEKIAVAKDISILRREITTIRRVVIPLKRTIGSLTIYIQKFSEEDLTAYFDDVKDHLDKVIDALEEAKETIEIYKDTDFMLSTEKTNKILAVLTIVFTLSIPATIISTFYGMNINLPGGNVDGNEIGLLGMYSTLLTVIVSSITLTLIMVFYFRKLGWLGGLSKLK